MSLVQLLETRDDHTRKCKHQHDIVKLSYTSTNLQRAENLQDFFFKLQQMIVFSL